MSNHNLNYSCGNCYYFVALDDDEPGQCHRHPPILNIKKGDGDMFVFPEVLECDWCGMHDVAIV